MSKAILWTSEAKRDIRAITQPFALDILQSLARFVATGHGDVKTLQGKHASKFRLRIGSYRLIFHDHDDQVEVLQVKHRKDAYR